MLTLPSGISLCLLANGYLGSPHLEGARPSLAGSPLDSPTPGSPLLSTTFAPAGTSQADATADPKTGRRPVRSRRHVAPYLGYVGYFVGAGLISGGIVHYPLDPARYAKVAIAGIVVFLAATVLNEVLLPGVRPSLRAMTRIVGAALLLSVGIGMLSGGIQHFMDFPARAAMLIPAGLVVSFVAYVVKHASRRRLVLARLGLVVLVVAAGLFWGLSQFATSLDSAGGHGHEDGGHTQH